MGHLVAMTCLQQSLTDDAFVQDPYPVYHAAREAGPVLYWEEMGMWAAFDHATVSALLRDRRLGRTPVTPKHRPAHLEPFRALEDDSLLELEPPRHTRLRALVLRAFTSRRVAELRADIESVAGELVAALPRDGEFDLIPAYCQPLPVRIIARLLGVPESVAPQLLAWSRDMVAMYQAGVTPTVERRAGQAAADFAGFMRGYLEERRSRPGNDLITHLIQAEQDGARLSTDEMVSTCILLLNAGHEATVHTLGNATRALIEHGALAEPKMTEELLRFDAPLHVFARVAYERVALPGGHHLERGDEIALVLGAANRDPVVFPGPDRFDPSRTARPHVSFGGGLHFCLGAPLARAELEIALPSLFSSLPGLRLTEPPRYANSYHFHKHDRLMVAA